MRFISICFYLAAIALGAEHSGDSVRFGAESAENAATYLSGRGGRRGHQFEGKHFRLYAHRFEQRHHGRIAHLHAWRRAAV